MALTVKLIQGTANYVHPSFLKKLNNLGISRLLKCTKILVVYFDVVKKPVEIIGCNF